MLLICFFFASHLAAHENEFAFQEPEDINRYQMEVVSTGDYGVTEIYLLDKRTGIIWMTREKLSWTGNFEGYYSWIQLPSLPIQ